MIRISRRAVLAAGVLPALPLEAEDFWVSKKPSEWSEKELSKILSDSPWAQKVEISMGGAAPSGGMGGGGGKSRRGGGGMTGVPTAEQGSMGSGPTTGDMGGGGGGGMGGSTMVPTIPFVIRWVSAAPIKEAFVRVRLGKEAETSQQAKDYLSRAEPHYVVAVIGPPRRAPQQQGAEGGGQRPGPSEEMKSKMKAETLLHRKGKPDLHPEIVEVVEGAAQTLVFRFARTDEITLEDKDVEFSTKFGRLDIKRKFRLKDMSWQGKLAL